MAFSFQFCCGFYFFLFAFTSFQSLAFLLMLSYWWHPAIDVNSLRVSFSFRQCHCCCSIFALVRRLWIHLHFSIRILRLHCPGSMMAIRCWFMHSIPIHPIRTTEKWKTNKRKKSDFYWMIHNPIFNIHWNIERRRERELGEKGRDWRPNAPLLLEDNHKVYSGNIFICS